MDPGTKCISKNEKSNLQNYPWKQLKFKKEVSKWVAKKRLKVVENF
jgi:hypothetical protein